MKNKPTKADLAIFKKECLRLADLWGLNSWTFTFTIGDSKEFEGASVSLHFSNLQADLFLESLHPDSTIKESARHEMLHVLIGKLYLMAKCRYLDEDDIDRTDEELVHQLDRIIPKEDS